MSKAKANSVEPVTLNINRISNGTRIIGNVEAAGDLRVDGHIEGSIVTIGKVVIGETGSVKGDIKARNLDMMGELTGNIIVSDTVFLKRTSSVVGNMTTNKLVIESGAMFNGTCSMGESKEEE